MQVQSAEVLLAAIRKSGASLMTALVQLKNEMNAEEFERWSRAVGRSMAKIQDELLEPLLEEHPEITPKSLGGTTGE